MTMRIPSGVRVVLASLVAVACGGGGGGGGTGPGFVTLAKSSGDPQTGVVTELLASDFCVIVKEDNAPKDATTVTWTSSTADAALTPPSNATNASGIACARMTLGQLAGAQTAQAAVSGAAGSPVTFIVTADAAGPAVLEKTTGENQTATVGVAFVEPLGVRALDPFQNGANGVQVAWSVTQGSANLSQANTTTSGNGLAAGSSSITVTPTAAGSITVQSAAGALIGSPQIFHLTANPPPPPPTAITITVGNLFFRSNRNNTSPAVDTVKAGGTVTWTWAVGAVGHTATSDNASFTTGTEGSPQNAPFSTGAITMNLAPGTYGYHCEIHGSPGAAMFGTLVIVP